MTTLSGKLKSGELETPLQFFDDFAAFLCPKKPTGRKFSNCSNMSSTVDARIQVRKLIRVFLE